MKRRGFLGQIGLLAAAPIALRLPNSSDCSAQKPLKSSRWLKLLDRGFDLSPIFAYSPQKEIRIIDLAGTMVSIFVIDRMFSELSGNIAIELFPKSPWKGCYILSQPFYLSSYMAMRYELTAEKDNAELDRAHEGAIWTIDSRIPKDVVLFEAANGNLGLVRRAANYEYV